MIKRVMEELDFPCEAIEQLTKKFAELIASPAAKEKLHEAYDCLFGYKEGDYMALAKEMSEITGIHDHTVEMLLLLGAADILRYVYNAKGLPDKVWRDSMCDLRYKLFEYKKLSGLWGTNVGWWYKDFYTLKRFALGRLQFNFEEFRENEHYAVDVGLKNGDKVLDVHIQQDGPFTDELCGESFKMAEEFYEKYFSDFDYKAFTCHSWLLSPGLSQVLPETSNIIKFGKRFTILEYDPENDGQAVERIFETRFKGENFKPTSLQERARKLLDEGGHLGIAMGVILK